jgi:hypothetical protein
MVMFHSYASLPEGEDHVGVGQNDELHQDGQVHHVGGCCLTHAQSWLFREALQAPMAKLETFSSHPIWL